MEPFTKLVPLPFSCRYKMTGMDRTDSICLDPHKMLASIL